MTLEGPRLLSRRARRAPEAERAEGWRIWLRSHLDADWQISL